MVAPEAELPTEHTAEHNIVYAFGNHMHWADMEWLWGSHVLSASVHDMLRVCANTGAYAHINFDAIGYEKLASEDPEALAALRDAIHAGTVEIAGGSYGQPYGLFHGAESNARQLIFGTRTIVRLFGVHPRLFWEEEFYFFPQLPQLLCSAGYGYAALFFKETWHTPAVPMENETAVLWEGMDGSQLLTAPRNKLNVRQWPEEFRRLRARLAGEPLLQQAAAPLILQWLELMPSRDWMCRAEVVLPEIRKLLDDPLFAVRFATLPQYLEPLRAQAPARSYTLDDVFHGMSIGKNGDLLRRLSRRAESSALAAESLSALLGLFGRPYASWDVYPTWELDEAWRELLSAQHHDNEECEGLCGYVGRYSYERSLQLTAGIVERGLRLLARRAAGSAGDLVVYNPLGWERTDVVVDPQTGSEVVVADVPAFGYRSLARTAAGEVPPVVLEDGETVRLRRGALAVGVHRESGAITELVSMEFPAGIVAPGQPLATFQMICGDELESFGAVDVYADCSGPASSILVRRRARDGSELRVRVSLAPVVDAVDLHVTSNAVPRSDSRMAAALQMPIGFRLPGARLIHDHPYGISEIRAEGTYRRKYPTGDWMTSPQVYEEVHNPFTALSFVDFVAGAVGVLCIHDGAQGMMREGDNVHNLLSMHDAWDEDYFAAGLDARMRILPHGVLTNCDRWRRAQEFNRPLLAVAKPNDSGDIPATFAGPACASSAAAATAFYREAEVAGRHCTDYAGTGMHFPYIVRLVELNGDAAEASLQLPGRAAVVRRAGLCGENEVELPVNAAARLAGEPGASCVPVTLHPHAIATVYVDLEMGRKVFRDLDSQRHVWAGGESHERRLEPPEACKDR